MMLHIPNSKVHGANMGPTWVLSSPGGPHVVHMNLVIWDVTHKKGILSGHLLSDESDKNRLQTNDKH